MSGLDVEPVETIDVDESAVPAGVDAPEYVLYGGKGGVGKTTMAAATALASARGGTPTLVVSTDPAHSLSDAFGRDVPADPALVHDDYPLYGVEIDPDTALAEGGLFGTGAGGGGAGGLGLGGLLGDVGADPLAGGAMPGADETAALRLLLEYLDDERFERVVVDTAPTGHTLRLLELPELMDTTLGRVMQFRERLSGLFDGVGDRFGGAGGPGDVDGGGSGPTPEAGLDDLRTLRGRIETLRAALRDPARTDFRLVLVPETMSVTEARRLLTRLEEFGIPVGTVVVNRVMEDLGSVADVDAERFVAPDLEGCDFCGRRWRVQQAALEEAQSVFRGRHVARVPLFADEVRGEEMLRLVAACLAR